MIDSAPKNVTAYALFCLLSIVVGMLTDFKGQLKGTEPFDLWSILASGIDALIPALTMMLLAMKLASVGHEAVASKAVEHEDALELDDPVEPAPVDPERVRVIPATATVEADGRG